MERGGMKRGLARLKFNCVKVVLRTVYCCDGTRVLSLSSLLSSPTGMSETGLRYMTLVS